MQRLSCFEFEARWTSSAGGTPGIEWVTIDPRLDPSDLWPVCDPRPV